MGRKRSGRGGINHGPKRPASAPGARVKKMQSYEDTLEEGGVDDFMFKRDQITFNPQNESDEEDILGGQGEEVLSLNLPTGDGTGASEESQEGEEPSAPSKKERKKKAKPDMTGKGRFGKPVVSSDEDDFGSASGSDLGSEDEEEGWGRQYYSRPSNRREKEGEGVDDEEREEERAMEEKEVRRLQRKAREAMGGAEDWGLEMGDGEEEIQLPTDMDEEDRTVKPVAPITEDPAVLMRHLEAHEPVKLALTRDLPLIVHKLQKTARGIRKMETEEPGEESLHKGLGWLHYQTLVTYATNLTFYIHLCYLPRETRPDLSSHPILDRLLQLKEGLSMLEDLDFAAGSISDLGPLARDDDAEISDEEGELQALIGAKQELMARFALANGTDWEEDADDLWEAEGLDDGELEDLLADAQDGEGGITGVGGKGRIQKEGSVQKIKNKDKKEKKKITAKKAIKANGIDNTTAKPTFTPLVEPTFFSSSLKKSKSNKQDLVAGDEDESLGDSTSLNEADATDKEKRKRSLKFHTSKISATSARRSAARAQRLGGDEDLPYRDRKAARDSALRKNGLNAGDGGEDLDGSEWSEGDRKRAREVMGDGEELGAGAQDDADDDGDDGYYDLVKRRRTESKQAKQEEHDALQAAKFAQFETDETTTGPRSLTRAIEKNRGLTPHRSKTGRNPRVKKRMAYEKAKQKVSSQRAVFKGGQAALGGAYRGEKTGISTVVKSRKF